MIIESNQGRSRVAWVVEVDIEDGTPGVRSEED